MSERQQDFKPAKNRDNASKYHMVYPGACKKILSPINQSDNNKNLSNTHIDHSYDDNGNFRSNNIKSSEIYVAKNEELKFGFSTNKNIDVEHNNNNRGQLIDSAGNKELTSAKNSYLNEVVNLKSSSHNRPSDLDWIDSRKVQSDSARRRQSLSSRNSNNLNPKNNADTRNPKQRSNTIKSEIDNKTNRRFSAFQYNTKVMASNTGVGVSPIANESDTILFDISNDEPTTFYDDEANLEGQLADGQMPEYRTKRGQEGFDHNQLDEPIIDTLLRDLRGIYQKIKIIALPNSPDNIYKTVLRGWDLWGPLLLCTFLAFNLHNNNNYTTSTDKTIGPHFADVFVLIWFGSGLLSLNYRLLSLSSINDQSVQIISSNIDTSKIGTSGDKTSINNKIIDDTTSSSQPSQNVADLGFDGATTSLHNQDGSIQLSISPPSILQLMCVFGYCLVAPSLGLIILKFVSINNLMFVRIIVGLISGFIWPTWISIKILNRYQHPNKQALAIYPIGLFYFILSCMIILNQ